MAPGHTDVFPLALICSGLEKEEKPWSSLKLHPSSSCKNMLRALGQVFCLPNPGPLICRGGVSAHILPAWISFYKVLKGDATCVEVTHERDRYRNRRFFRH